MILLGNDDSELTGELKDLRQVIQAQPEGWLRIMSDGQRMWLDQGQ